MCGYGVVYHLEIEYSCFHDENFFHGSQKRRQTRHVISSHPQSVG